MDFEGRGEDKVKRICVSDRLLQTGTHTTTRFIHSHLQHSSPPRKGENAQLRERLAHSRQVEKN